MEPRPVFHGSRLSVDPFDLSHQENISDHKACSAGDKKDSQWSAPGQSVAGEEDAGEHSQFDEYDSRSFQR